MSARKMKIANLDEASLEKLRNLEEAYGAIIVALEPHYPLAELSDEQVNMLKKLEEELGVVLIAYRP